MYSYSHSVETEAQPEAVWKFYSEVALWPHWDSSIQEVKLNGPFAVGTTGTMVIEGQPPLPVNLIEVTPNVSFSDETVLTELGLIITFKHTLTALSDGKTRITHDVIITGPAAETLGTEMGPNVTSDVPDAMEALARCAEEKAV